VTGAAAWLAVPLVMPALISALANSRTFVVPRMLRRRINDMEEYSS